MPKLTKEKEIVFTAIEQQVDELNAIGDNIWRYCEVPGEEFKSHECIVKFLKKKGFDVDENYLGYETSFKATFGDGEVGGSLHPNIGFLCEYDADPVNGHCYGKNLMTVVSLAAAIGLQHVIKFSTEPLGRVTLIGCQGNSQGTMKMTLHKNNAFKNIDFLLCAYPAHFTNTCAKFNGCKTRQVSFTGRSYSENSKPWEVANPVNAVVLGYQNVAQLRQQFKPDWTVKGVIPDGGKKAGVIPDKATMEFFISAPLPKELLSLEERLDQCFDAASTATGCQFEARNLREEFFSSVPCPHLGKLYTNNAKLNGFTFYNPNNDIRDADDISAITISVPTMKVYYYAGSSAALGTYEFNTYVGCPESQFMSLVQGKSLGMVGVDLMKVEDNMRTVFEDHKDLVMENYEVMMKED